MISLNDIIINERTYKDVLRASYKGTEFHKDSRNLNILRKGIMEWENLTQTQYERVLNQFTTCFNVFDPYQLMRFLLSNIDPKHHKLLITIANHKNVLYPIYVNINMGDVESLPLVDDSLLKIERVQDDR